MSLRPLRSVLVVLALGFGACATAKAPVARAPGEAPSDDECASARRSIEQDGAATTSAVRTVAACDEAQGNVAAATGRWEQAFASDPGDRTLALHLANILLAQGRPHDAAAVASRALDKHPEDPELHFVHATALDQDGSSDAAAHAYDEAARLYDEAVARDPENAELRVAYGRALAQMKHKAGAAHEFRIAIALEDVDAHTLSQAALGIGQLGDDRACIEALDRALSAPIHGDPRRGRAELLRSRADCRHALGDDPGAIADAKASLDLVPELDTYLAVAQWERDAGDRVGCHQHALAASKFTTDLRKARAARLLADACAKD